MPIKKGVDGIKDEGSFTSQRRNELGAGKGKVKQSHYRPGVAQSVPGS